jgi:hypothetical protein
MISVVGRWFEFKSHSSTKTNSFCVVTVPQHAIVDIFAASERVEGEEEEKERY